MSPRQEAAAILVLVLGLLTAAASLAGGCSERRTRYVSPPPAASLAPAPDPEPEEVRTPPDPRRLLSYHSWEVGVGSINDQEPLAPVGRWLPTARGVLVWVPQAVELVPGRANELLSQVDSATSDPDTRLPADAKLPPGSRVIPVPGAFELSGSGFPLWAVGLAGGPAWFNPDGSYSLVCWVSWRPSQAEPRLLPALRHEIRHLLSGDPLAGHPGGCCNAWMVPP